MQAAITLEQLEFGWTADQPLLSIQSLQVARGERVFLQGASGSGKSTLLNLIGGVLEPQKGAVHLLDVSLHALNKSRRDHFRADHIGFVFQMFNLLPYLNVLDNVALPCRFSRARREKAQLRDGSVEAAAQRLLDHLELSDSKLLQRPVTELSMGQQQRVAVARALIGSPEILIADEPTSALDVANRDRFLELLLSECAQEQTTLLFVSHDPGLQSHFDRVENLTQLNAVTTAEETQ